MTTTLPPLVEAIARSICGRLPADEVEAFDAAVAAAAAGRDLSRLPWQFLGAELRSLPAQPPQIQAVVDPVIAGLDQLAAGQEWPGAAAAAAMAAAATSGVTAVASGASWPAWTAWAAAAAADADAARCVVAVWAPADAADAADAAAAAVAAATRAAAADASLAATRRQRDLLLQLLAEA